MQTQTKFNITLGFQRDNQNLFEMQVKQESDRSVFRIYFLVQGQLECYYLKIINSIGYHTDGPVEACMPYILRDGIAHDGQEYFPSNNNAGIGKVCDIAQLLI